MIGALQRRKAASPPAVPVPVAAEGLPRRTRRSELILIIGALVIVAASYVLASLGRNAVMPADVVPFLVAVGGLLVVAHLATRRLAKQADPTLLPIAAFLNGLGYVLIARIDEGLAFRQAGWTALGVIAYVVTLAVVKRVRSLKAYSYTFGLVSVALLLLPLMPVLGRSKYGARIWISAAGFTFQPGEAAKIALALFLAAFLAERGARLASTSGPFGLPEPKYLGPLGLALAVSLAIIMFERDLGTALLMFSLFLAVTYVGTGQLRFVIGGLIAFGVGAYVAWLNFSHVQVRVSNWLNPWSDPFGEGFQVTQGHFALAWGGLTGTGLGLGMAQQTKLPLLESDYIFAVVGEELGLLGATAVLAAYLLLFGAGLRTASRASDPYMKLLATGLSTLIGFQAFVIIGGVVRLVPLTGVTLPFISYGGSSLLANYVLLALLIRISDEVDAEAAEAARIARRGRRSD